MGPERKSQKQSIKRFEFSLDRQPEMFRKVITFPNNGESVLFERRIFSTPDSEVAFAALGFSSNHGVLVRTNDSIDLIPNFDKPKIFVNGSAITEKMGSFTFPREEAVIISIGQLSFSVLVSKDNDIFTIIFNELRIVPEGQQYITSYKLDFAQGLVVLGGPLLRRFGVSIDKEIDGKVSILVLGGNYSLKVDEKINDSLKLIRNSSTISQIGNEVLLLDGDTIVLGNHEFRFGQKNGEGSTGARLTYLGKLD